MKFRIEKDTIKFRLTPDEIEIFKANNKLSDNIFISEGNSFEYTVKSTVKEKASISFVSNSITAIIPQAILDDWFQSEKIGVKEDIINENGDSITLVVEEDLPPRKIKKGNR